MGLIEEILGGLWGLYCVGCILVFFSHGDFIEAVTWPWTAYREIRRQIDEP